MVTFYNTRFVFVWNYTHLPNIVFKKEKKKEAVYLIHGVTLCVAFYEFPFLHMNEHEWRL